MYMEGLGGLQRDKKKGQELFALVHSPKLQIFQLIPSPCIHNTEHRPCYPITTSQVWLDLMHSPELQLFQITLWLSVHLLEDPQDHIRTCT